MTNQTTQPVPLSDIKWTYDLVHSKMYYCGLSFDDACKEVEATFDGTQPQGLFEAVKGYYDFIMEDEKMNTYEITFYTKRIGLNTQTVQAKTAIRAKNKLEKIYGKIHTLSTNHKIKLIE
jgi:hypothetical protein